MDIRKNDASFAMATSKRAAAQQRLIIVLTVLLIIAVVVLGVMAWMHFAPTLFHTAPAPSALKKHHW